MTSSFTAMMLAATLAFHRTEDGAPDVARIARASEDLIHRHNATLRELAAKSYSRVVYLGSNGFKGLAREAALKLLELTDGRVIAAFDSPLGFRHGPKTIVTRDTLLFVFISNDPYTRRYDLDLLGELRSDALAGRVIAITAQLHDAVIQGEYLHVAELADVGDGDLYYPYIVCAQLYAFHRSLSLDNKPDQPSNSGTVNRVVRGVTIHSL
jgi:tagatose-6-phosphate ketose/aldose isomerase